MSGSVNDSASDPSRQRTVTVASDVKMHTISPGQQILCLTQGLGKKLWNGSGNDKCLYSSVQFILVLYTNN